MLGIYFNMEGDTWSNYFDDSIWKVSAAGSWDGSKWVADGSRTLRLEPATASTWYVGFRPTKVRVTGTVGTQSSSVDLVDSDTPFPNIIADGGTEAVLVVDTLDWSNGLDLAVYRLYGYDTVTNIEFFGG